MHYIDLMDVDSKITEKGNVQKVELSVSLSWLSESGKYTCKLKASSPAGLKVSHLKPLFQYKCEREIVFISLFSIWYGLCSHKIISMTK